MSPDVPECPLRAKINLVENPGVLGQGHVCVGGEVINEKAKCILFIFHFPP